MKVLFVVWNLYPNTAYTNHTKATVQGMQENDCCVDVLSIKPIITKESICIRGQYRGKSFLSTVIGVIWGVFLLAISTRKYDIVYCAFSNRRVLRFALRSANRHRIPIVHERTEFPDLFYKNNGKGKKGLSKYLQIVPRFDLVFVISSQIKDYFIENGVRDEKLVIYPMVVDPRRFNGIEKKNRGFNYIAYCGNLSNSKDGLADLIEAFGRSHAKVTHKLLLIGDKPSEAEMSLYRELIMKYKIQGNVVFLGRVSREEMPQVLSDADLLVLCRPNNHQAKGGFPTKLGEYLATGNPVLVTDVGDISKYIIDGENGYLSSPNDVEAFSQKMDLILSDYAKAMKVGEKGKDLVYDEFNYRIQAGRVVERLRLLV